LLLSVEPIAAWNGRFAIAPEVLFDVQFWVFRRAINVQNFVFLEFIPAELR